MEWLYAYGAKTDCKDLEVILWRRGVKKYIFMSYGKKNLVP